MLPAPPNKNVFINCPFDGSYVPILRAIVFTVRYLAFVPRCALESDNAGETRLTKIERIVADCPYGIHDLSAVDLDPNTDLPRFNMPFELGLFFGCKRFGGRAHKTKSSLILDRDAFRYRSFLSDVSGQDIHAHGRDPNRAIREVRNWLATENPHDAMPGAAEIIGRYEALVRALPTICAGLKLDSESLTFSDWSRIVLIGL